MKILLVEDDAGIRAALATNLEARGYDVTEAEHGDEGYILYTKNFLSQENKFAAVITDYQFPYQKIKNGVELALAIRALNPKQRIVIHTGSPLRILPDALADVRILSKPYKIKEELIPLLEAK